MKQQESHGGKNCGRGASGEFGCYQYMPDTWSSSSKAVIGYVVEQTRINEEYVTLIKIQRLLNANPGWGVREVALFWNQGHIGECSSGINKKIVAYDSCKHVNAVVAYYSR